MLINSAWHLVTEGRELKPVLKSVENGEEFTDCNTGGDSSTYASTGPDIGAVGK